MPHLPRPRLRRIIASLITVLPPRAHLNLGKAPCLVILSDIHPRIHSILLRMPLIRSRLMVMTLHMVIIIGVDEAGTVTAEGEAEAEAEIMMTGKSPRIRAGLGLGIEGAGTRRPGVVEGVVGIEYHYRYAHLYLLLAIPIITFLLISRI